MKKAIILQVILILLLIFTLNAQPQQGTMNSDDVFYHCKAKFDPNDSTKIIQTYSMNNVDWKCDIENLKEPATNDYWIKNCLQYDTTRAKVKLSRGDYIGRDSRLCVLCDCDFGLSYDGELCLENEFRVKNCHKYEQNGRDCSECKYQLNEKVTSGYDPFTTASQYPFHAKHYQIDYGLKYTGIFGQPEYRTQCVNNLDKASDGVKNRVKNCKIYEKDSDTNCKVCQFKDSWPNYIFQASSTSPYYVDEANLNSATVMTQVQQWSPNHFYKYKLIRSQKYSGTDKYYGCGYLPLQYETDPLRIEVLFDTKADNKQYVTNFICAKLPNGSDDRYKKILTFTDPVDSQNLKGFQRDRYTALSNGGCTPANAGTKADVIGCYEYVGPAAATAPASDCDIREINDEDAGITPLTKKVAKEQQNAADGTFTSLKRIETDDFINYDINKLYLNYGKKATCIRCKKIGADTFILSQDNLSCKKQSTLPDCKVALSDTQCYECALKNAANEDIQIDINKKCVKKIPSCQPLSHDNDKCLKCDFGYGYYKIGTEATNNKECFYTERMHASQKLKDNTPTFYKKYDYGYDVWGLGGCQSIKDKRDKIDGVNTDNNNKGYQCEICNDKQGFIMKGSDDGANLICTCNPSLGYEENKISRSYCRPKVGASDECEIYYYIDSNGNKRCEKCKYVETSIIQPYDGVICPKQTAEAVTFCAYPMKRFTETQGIDSWCRLCAKDYNMTNLGYCALNTKKTGAVEEITASGTVKAYLNGYVFGCRQIEYYMERATESAGIEYNANRLTYQWKMQCYEAETAKRDKYNCWNNYYWDTGSSTCKSYNDDSGEKCLAYENWELGRCIKCTTSYTNIVNFLPLQPTTTGNNAKFKCTADTHNDIKDINQKANCVSYGLNASNVLVCRQCDSTSGQNFGITSATAPKFSTGIDCKPPGAASTFETRVKVKNNYKQWDRYVIQCSRVSDTEQYRLKSDSSACEKSTVTGKNCRVQGADVDKCPGPSADIDVCYLDLDYGYIFQEVSAGAGAPTAVGKCIDNTSTTIKGATQHCLTYAEAAADLAVFDISVATGTAIECKKCKYGYSLNAAKICERAIEYCEEFMHIKNDKWNQGYVAADTNKGFCIKCAPGYAPKNDGTQCFKSPHTACVVGKADDQCEVCAGPFFLASDQCYERIPNCMVMDLTSPTKCKKCEAGYGEFPTQGSGTKCIIGMEGCTEFEKLDEVNYDEKKCKVCKKDCPKNNSYNWRYFNLSPLIKKPSDNLNYAWCVEGCAEFETNSTLCKRCVKYSDVDDDLKLIEAKKPLDIQFYYNDNKLCKRRIYISKNCETYDDNADKCTKCYTSFYLKTDSAVNQCDSCTGKMNDPSNGTCQQTNGLGLDSNNKCVCTKIQCNDKKVSYINDKSTPYTCVARTNTCDSALATSYVENDDKCTSCNTSYYLQKDANLEVGKCVIRPTPAKCGSTCQLTSPYRDGCDEVVNKSTSKDGCSDTSGSWFNQKKGWDQDSLCCIDNQSDAKNNVQPTHCRKYASYSSGIKCAECEKDFFRVKVLIAGETNYKITCIYRPNCKAINNQCIGNPDTDKTTCPQVDGTDVLQSSAGWKVIRKRTQCIECNNNTFADNYGLVYRENSNSVSSEGTLCGSDTMTADEQEKKYNEESTCCVKNKGYKETVGTSPTYDYTTIVGCKEYWPKGSYTKADKSTASYHEITYCKECHQQWLLRESTESQTGVSVYESGRLNNYCFYMQTPCQIDGCKLLQNIFTIDWLKCRACYQQNEKRVTPSTIGYDINTGTHVCDDYNPANGNDGGSSKPAQLDGQGGVGVDGGITDLPTPKPDPKPDPKPTPDDKKTTGFSSILSIGIETICVLAFGIFAFLI